MKDKIETIEKDDNKEEMKFDNQYEVLSDIPKPKSGIKKNITSDYIYAKLGQAEKDFITENYRNAEFAKEILMRYATTPSTPKWNIKKKDWDRNEDGSIKYYSLEEIDKKGADKCKRNAKRIFEFFMIHPEIMVNLNRNRDDNFIIKLLGKYKDEEEKIAQYTEDDRSMIQKIRDKINGENEEYRE